MSYARKGLHGSDVYVYATGNDWVCHECSLAGAGSVHCTSSEDMIHHLTIHGARGEEVPRAAFERLETDEPITVDPEDTRVTVVARRYGELAQSLPPERRDRAERKAYADLVERDLEAIADLPGPRLAAELATLTLDEVSALHALTQRLLRNERD